MYATNEMLEQVLTAMLDADTISENACHALLSSELPMVRRLGFFVSSKTITSGQANLITRSIQNLKRAA